MDEGRSMTEHNPSQSTSLPASRRFLPVLLVLFVGSGCSALIYEIVWFQLLQLVIGSSAVSLGVLLGTFMGGMCLGSFTLPRMISPRRHPLRVYALMEVGIGIIGVAVLFGMPYVDQLYATHVGHGLASIIMRGAVCAMCLLLPTLLMGATLPAVARWVEATPQGISWLGFFYGGNIAGATFGCLLAGFYLLRVHDMVLATYVAATLNFTVAVIGLLLASRTVYQAPRVSPPFLPSAEGTGVRAPRAATVYVVIGLSGLCALGAEVVWTRILSLLLGGTVYTFSIILAVFLAGLGIGSSIGSVISRQSPRPRAALGGCQLLLTGAIAWAAYILAESLPYWPVNPTLSRSPWLNFQLDLMRCIWAVLPGAILWGASFPLALASVASQRQDPGRLVGGVYAANTVGAIIGSLAFSMVLIPWLGTRGSQQLMIGLSAASALLIFVSLVQAWWAAGSAGGKPSRRGIAAGSAWAGLAVVPVLVALLIWSVPTVPWGLTAYGRHMATWVDRLSSGITKEEDVPFGDGRPDMFCTYAREGMNVSIAVTESTAGVRSFHGAGKVQASNDPQDMRLQRMLGHIAGLTCENPQSVLVVACGAGVTAGTFVLYPSIARIVICDIEPLVPKYVAPKFSKENYDVVNDPRTEVICDDGRHFIRTTSEKFDIITSDPIDPWVKGCAALNTQEYYRMCKAHLNPGGIMTLWMPLYESNPETAKSFIATFFKVFPNGILWSNDINGEGYDAVLFGQAEPANPSRPSSGRINVDELQRRLDSTGNGSVAQSLEDVGFHSAIDLLATYAGQASRLQEWMADAQINTDRNLRLQYLAGMSLNCYLGREILDEIVQYYEFPDELFFGSDERMQALRELIEKTRQIK